MILIATKHRICSLPTNSSIQTLVISTSPYYAASEVIAVNLLKSRFDFISFHPLWDPHLIPPPKFPTLGSRYPLSTDCTICGWWSSERTMPRAAPALALVACLQYWSGMVIRVHPPRTIWRWPRTVLSPSGRSDTGWCGHADCPYTSPLGIHLIFFFKVKKRKLIILFIDITTALPGMFFYVCFYIIQMYSYFINLYYLVFNDTFIEFQCITNLFNLQS